jgi:hypothetical protein
MEKTVIEWLETIADNEIREKAINYLLSDIAFKSRDNNQENLMSAINSFHWRQTKEGYDYWSQIQCLAVNGQLPTREVDQVDEVKEKTIEEMFPLYDSHVHDRIKSEMQVNDAIYVLKQNGFKVMKPTTTWEEA